MDKARKLLSVLVKEYSVVLVLVLLIIISSLISDVFLGWGNISNILRQQMPIMMLSLGMLFVILTGGIDLAVGSVTALSSITFALMVTDMFPEATMWQMAIALIAAVAMAALAGAVTGILVSVFRVAPFVASLAMMTIARGFSYVLSEGEPIRFSPDSEAGRFLDGFGSGKMPGIALPWPVLVGIIVIIITFIVLRYTAFGRITIAIGSNSKAVHLSGINVKKNTFKVYLISGVLCGLAGVMIVARSGVGVPSTAEGYELDALAANVVGGASLAGGKGSTVNTVMGVLVFGLISNIMNLMSMPVYPQQIVKGLIIIAAVLVQGVNHKE
jgi:ribose transport system permease protein